MVELFHGSNLSLAPALGPLVRITGTVREALDRLTRSGFTWVQLDATLSGVRPRELNQRARRDLAALIARQGMALGGMDFFIPRSHYADPSHIDRAMSATLSAIDLAADLGKLPLSISLPVKAMPEDAKKALVEAADGHSVPLAIHAEDHLQELLAWLDAVDLRVLGAAIDPATLLAQGQDPVALTHQLSRRLIAGRLSDAEAATQGMDDAGGSPRRNVGEGDLDLSGYRIALDLASHRVGPVVLDVRGLVSPFTAAQRAKDRWEEVAPSLG